MSKKLKIVDGAFGEGGGQILRSTLSLAMCTKTPVRIENIRAGRRKSGLLRQHLACVRASKAICNADVKGDQIGSSRVDFIPRDIQAGEFNFAIGSAGSTSLVFQTVLPALLMANQKSTVCLSGGTHNGLAPSFDFIEQSFIPAMARMGVHIDAELEAYGFAPNGGGSWVATVHPVSQLSELSLTKKGSIRKYKAVVTQCGVDIGVANRELARIKRKLGWSKSDLQVIQVESVGPGNILSLRVSDEHITEVIEQVGAKGVKAERVAGKAIAAVKRYLNSGAVVGEYLCDQLLLPLALGRGGRFTTVKPSLHTETNIAVIKRFVDCSIDVNEHGDDLFEVVITT